MEYESDNVSVKFFIKLLEVRRELLKMVKTEFTAKSIKALVRGEDTNGNENLNWVDICKVNKRISHVDPILYDSQVAHGVSQFNHPYIQIVEKFSTININPTHSQMKVIQARIKKLQYNASQRKKLGFVDSRVKKRRRLNKQAKQTKNDEAYKTDAYHVK